MDSFVAFAPRNDGGSNRIIDAPATAASSIEIDANILQDTTEARNS
jgi:hypothetical protein